MLNYTQKFFLFLLRFSLFSIFMFSHQFFNLQKPRKNCVKRPPTVIREVSNKSEHFAKLVNSKMGDKEMLLGGLETHNVTPSRKILKYNAQSDKNNDVGTEKELDTATILDHVQNSVEDSSNYCNVNCNKIERALKNLSPKKMSLISDRKTTRSGRQFSPYDFDSFNLFRSHSFCNDRSNTKMARSIFSSPTHNKPLDTTLKWKQGENIDDWLSSRKKFLESKIGDRELETNDLRNFLPTEDEENLPVERKSFAEEDVASLIGVPPTFSCLEGHRLPQEFFDLSNQSDVRFEITWPIDCDWKDVYSYKGRPNDTDDCDEYLNTYPSLKDVETFSFKRYLDVSDMKALSKISLFDASKCGFQSAFKDVYAQIAHFENKTGHLMGVGDGRKFDIMESEKDEKKRLYRKKITDSNLIAWHKYIVASSSKYSAVETIPSPRPLIRLPWLSCPRGDLIWRLNNTRPVPTVDDFFRGLTNCRKR